MSKDNLPSLKGVREAATRLEGYSVLTPVLESEILNDHLGCRVLLKMETLQRTGSFKFRGAYNLISRLKSCDHPGGVVPESK